MSLFDCRKLSDSADRLSNTSEIRRACFSAYLGDHTLACRVLGRFTILIDSRDRSQGMSLLMHGHWEIALTEQICQLVKPGMRVVDAGACWGYYSLLMSHLVGHTGRLIAVEPNPRTAKLLQESLLLNGFGKRSEVHACAIGNADLDAQSFVSRPGRFMNNHLLRSGEIERRPDTTSYLTEVNVRRLDTLVPESQIDLMKVDVEGSEQSLFTGMPLLLTRSPSLIILLEFNPTRLDSPSLFLDEVHNRFEISCLTSGGRVSASREMLLNSTADAMLICQPKN